MTVIKAGEQVQFEDRPTDLLREDGVSELSDWKMGEEPYPHLGMLVRSSETPRVSYEDRFISSFLHSLEEAVSRHLAKVEEAVATYFLIQGDVINIWTVLADYSRATRRKVYEQERRVIRELPEFSLYFRTIDREEESAPQSEQYHKVDLAQVRRDASF